MSILGNLRKRFGGGIGKAVTAASDIGWSPSYNGRSGFLPQSNINFGREVGRLWHNSVVRSILKWKADVMTEAQMVVYRPAEDGTEKTIRVHPLITLFQNPNPLYGGDVLEAGVDLSLNCDGNAYVFIDYAESGKVAGLYYLPHFLITPHQGGPYNWIDYYEYNQGNTTIRFEPEEILHYRDGVDPDCMVKGLSKLGAELKNIYSVNELETFEAVMLRNRGIPGVIISAKVTRDNPDGVLTPEQGRNMKAKFQESFTGDNRFVPFFSTLPMDVHNVAFKPNEMSLNELQKMPIASICSALNVDPMVLGYPSANQTYSNRKLAEAGAYQTCIKPAHRLIDRQTTRRLMPYMIGAQPGDRLGRDYSKVEALQEDRNELHKRVREDFKAGILERWRAKDALDYPFDMERDDCYYTDLMVDLAELQNSQRGDGQDNNPEDPRNQPNSNSNGKMLLPMPGLPAGN